jgi:hypothetical protein
MFWVSFEPALHIVVLLTGFSGGGWKPVFGDKSRRLGCPSMLSVFRVACFLLIDLPLD